MRTVEVLSDATNYNVVHSEGRRYPGLVVQGDRLHHWLGLARGGDIESLAEELAESVTEYDRVCREHGLVYPG